MKRSLILAIILSATFTGIHAQLLWKISGNGLKKTSYLFGSHHLIPVAFLDSVPGLYKAFNESDIIVSEVIARNIETSDYMRKAAVIPDKKTMKDLIPDSSYKALDAELKSVLKIGLKELSVLNPGLIYNLYETELFKKLTGVYDDAQSDSYFQIAAAEKDKKVVGLENIDQNLKLLFDPSNIQEQANKLVNTAIHKDSLTRELLMFNKLYKAGKINDLTLLWQRTENSDEINHNAKRHAEWMNQLPALIKENSCFITLELQHLIGDDGIITNLQKAGYKVKPME